MTKRALIIFTRNPILGQCKTRLAKTIGDKAALDVYTFLLAHTAQITAPLDCDIFVYYSNEISNNDCWNNDRYKKRIQQGEDLGQRMQSAFQDQLDAGYSHILLIGSDLYDLQTADLQLAFNKLDKNQTVLGPALDGGYYLIGLTQMIPQLFKNKPWGTNTVAAKTIEDLAKYDFELLELKNDIDYYQDMQHIDALMAFVPTSLQP
ncbi:MAG: TIGR04282 family arsenosugar biosynthesis glycosyltransferase [Gilvibacter sp.]